MPSLPTFFTRLPWPLPALLAWALAWLVHLIALLSGMPAWTALGLATLTGAGCSLQEAPIWRRALIAGGFPLSVLVVSGASGWPAWVWLAPLGALALVYPLQAWRDAPLFPTPAGALAGLAQLAPLRPGAAVLDAGCGLGHGLRELHRAYPQAHLHGLEWSWPLRAAAALLCPHARVRRADIWRHDWSGYDLVYLFQRPESMPRALAKARAEMQAGSWLVSLEFPAAEAAPDAVLDGLPGRRVWLYRMPARTASRLATRTATPTISPVSVPHDRELRASDRDVRAFAPASRNEYWSAKAQGGKQPVDNPEPLREAGPASLLPEPERVR